MTTNPRSEKTKKGIDPNETNKFPITSRQWSNNRNPRIVRVSRSFGGKDRHSKVCTVRGLRDRRIRLSVPTAIQLYDLQDRLGLNQPSKVVDWLLDATKNDIDKLPPLPMLPQFHEPTLLVSNIQESVSNNAQFSLSHFLSNQSYGKDKEHENQEGLGGFVAQNFFPLSHQSSFPNMPDNNFHWDPANLSLSQFGGGYSFSNQTDQDPRSETQASFLASSSSQLYLPPFPSYITPSLENIDMRSQIYNHAQQQNSVRPTTLHLINSPLRSLALNSRTGHSQENNNERERGKDNVNSPRK